MPVGETLIIFGIKFAVPQKYVERQDEGKEERLQEFGDDNKLPGFKRHLSLAGNDHPHPPHCLPASSAAEVFLECEDDCLFAGKVITSRNGPLTSRHSVRTKVTVPALRPGQGHRKYLWLLLGGCRIQRICCYTGVVVARQKER